MIKVIKFIMSKRDDIKGVYDCNNTTGPTWSSADSSTKNQLVSAIVYDAMIIYPIADFVQLVINNTELHDYIDDEKETFLHISNELLPELVLTVNHHETKWDNSINNYRLPNNSCMNYPNYELPHNRYAAMGRALLMLYKANGNQIYLDRVKILANKNTDEVLGVHMVGARVADLIMEAAVAMEYRASAEDLARICHGHPTYSEAVKEAAKAAWDGKPLNA